METVWRLHGDLCGGPGSRVPVSRRSAAVSLSPSRRLTKIGRLAHTGEQSGSVHTDGGMTVWSTQTVAALTTAVGGVAVAIISYVGKRRSDRKLAELNEQLDKNKAQRDYEYEARKRLYMEFQPLMFQLVESSDNAYWRIHGLARSAREGRLDPDKGSRLRANSKSYLLSTVYRFMAPLVLFRLCQMRLTVVDLSLDRLIHRSYAIAKVLYRTWNGGRNLAKLGCPIPYDPDGRADRLQPVADEAVQAVRLKQHLNLQEIEHLIEALTVKDEFTSNLRCMTLGEFMDAYRDKTSNVHKYGSCVKELFVDFRPGTRPVLWRILITQAYLYNALMNTFNGTTEALMDPSALLTLEHQKDFDWRRSDAEASFEQAVIEPFAAARKYLAQRLMLPPLQNASNVRSVQLASFDGLVGVDPAATGQDR
jgi:hypothetical protein